MVGFCHWAYHIILSKLDERTIEPQNLAAWLEVFQQVSCRCSRWRKAQILSSRERERGTWTVVPSNDIDIWGWVQILLLSYVGHNHPLTSPKPVYHSGAGAPGSARRQSWCNALMPSRKGAPIWDWSARRVWRRKCFEKTELLFHQ